MLIYATCGKTPNCFQVTHLWTCALGETVIFPSNLASSTCRECQYQRPGPNGDLPKHQEGPTSPGDKLVKVCLYSALGFDQDDHSNWWRILSPSTVQYISDEILMSSRNTCLWIPLYPSRLQPQALFFATSGGGASFQYLQRFALHVWTRVNHMRTSAQHLTSAIHKYLWPAKLSYFRVGWLRLHITLISAAPTPSPF